MGVEGGRAGGDREFHEGIFRRWGASPQSCPASLASSPACNPLPAGSVIVSTLPYFFAWIFPSEPENDRPNPLQHPPATSFCPASRWLGEAENNRPWPQFRVTTFRKQLPLWCCLGGVPGTQGHDKGGWWELETDELRVERAAWEEGGGYLTPRIVAVTS
jgi:hypothetical protein